MRIFLRFWRWIFSFCGWYFRWQNLNEKPAPRNEEVYGPLFIHGRCWLDNREEEPNYIDPTWELHVEWLFLFCKSCRLQIHFGSGDNDTGITFSIAIPFLFSLHFTLEGKIAKKICFFLLQTEEVVSTYNGKKFTVVSYGGDREISVRVFDWAIWWDCWVSPDTWKSDEKWWRQFTFRPGYILDFLFGEVVSKDVVFEEGEILIPMPERTYKGKYKIEQSTRYRKRWPWLFKRSRFYGKFECKDGIPIPGKGENSWDCGDDAIYGLSAACKSKHELIGKVVASVMRDRLRYGGSQVMNNAEVYL